MTSDKRSTFDEQDGPQLNPSTRRKKPISLTISPALLARVDERAEQMGLSRAAAVSLALSRFLDSEAQK